MQKYKNETLNNIVELYKKGGIHINPKNKGKFTASAKRAGMGVQEYANHILANKDKYSATLVKRANFARNAKRFKHQKGGIIMEPIIVTPDAQYTHFINTLPSNQKLNPESDYYTYKYWVLNNKPKDFNEAASIGMYTWNPEDLSFHANSIAYNPAEDTYYFMKPKHHPTVQFELDWYNKGVNTDDNGNQLPLKRQEKREWKRFRKRYDLDTLSHDYKYIPKKK